MVGTAAIRKLALSFPETDEYPHFERISFRVKKKIFVAVSEKDKTATLKLTPEDQSVFCSFDKEVIYPIPGAWGRKGWTIVDLRKVKKAILTDAITTAWCTVAPPKLAAPYVRR